jgi:hypothetical protein
MHFPFGNLDIARHRLLNFFGGICSARHQVDVDPLALLNSANSAATPYQENFNTTTTSAVESDVADNNKEWRFVAPSDSVILKNSK